MRMTLNVRIRTHSRDPDPHDRRILEERVAGATGRRRRVGHGHGPRGDHGCSHRGYGSGAADPRRPDLHATIEANRGQRAFEMADAGVEVAKARLAEGS